MIDHNDHGTDTRPGVAPEAVDTMLDKRAAARRRFLRIGAAGSSVLLTVVHQRAFAIARPVSVGKVVSTCVSGVADLKNAGTQNALANSVMGGVDNFICRRPGNTFPTSTCPAGSTDTQFVNSVGTPGKYDAAYSGPPGVGSALNSGCGTVELTRTTSRDFRLYEKGWCPIAWDGTSTLSYDTSAVYYLAPATPGPLLGPYACLSGS